MQNQPQPDGTPYPPYYPPQPQQATTPVVQTFQAPSALACTSCGSENVRTVPMVHAGGISNTTSRTSGVGFTGGGLGVGTATTKGVSQTALSQKLSPPNAPSLFKRLLGALVAAFVVSSFGGGGALGGILFLGALAGLGYWAWTTYTASKAEFDAAFARWQASFLCDRCGSVFVPNAMRPAQPAIVS